MDRKIFSRKSRAKKKLLQVVVLLMLASVMALEVLAVVAERRSRGPLPSFFGNHSENRELLEQAEPKDEFSFAVFGDTEGATGRYDLLAALLRRHPVDFAVHLGDAYAGTAPYFRMKLQDDFIVPFPVFFVAGNHDLDGLSLARFEEDFGPSLFSFTYQHALFVGLRVVGDAASSEESLRYLEEVLAEATVDRIFVFMHVPPQILPGYKFAAPREFNALFDRHGVDYVFAGHYHGYAHVRKGSTTYIVSGAAGKHLEESTYGQVPHALVLNVGRDYVSKNFVPLATTYNLTDKLTHFALVEVYPWIVRNLVLAFVGNLLVLVLMLMIIRSLRVPGR